MILLVSPISLGVASGMRADWAAIPDHEGSKRTVQLELQGYKAVR